MILHYSVCINISKSYKLRYIVTVYYFHTLDGHSRFGIPSMAGAVRSKVSYLTEYVRMYSIG